MKNRRSALPKITESAIEIHAIWIVLAAALIYYLTYFNYGIDLDDEGFLLANASAILRGHWPMADSFTYQPLSYFLLAFFFKLFGDGVFTERLMLMGLLLINIRLIYYCAIKLLPLRWALLPAAIYAFAPGPWYKVFFISHMLLSLAATLYFAERPDSLRAFIVGVSCGLAAISRIEAAALIAIVASATLYFAAWQTVPSKHVSRVKLISWIKTGMKYHLLFLVGMTLIVFMAIAAYWLNGKLPSLVANTLHYYNYFNTVSYVNLSSGRGSTFGMAKLFAPHSIEMWAYAIAMTACLINFVWFSIQLVARRNNDVRPLLGIVLAMFGVASMGYTYYFVWNSRMLSSFAIVYINYFILFALIYRSLSSQPAKIKLARLTAVLGSFLVVVYLQSFIKVQNYSGSFTTRMNTGMNQVANAKLKNIYVYPGQDTTINDLMTLTKDATTKDYLIPMSESTTLSYLSNLVNPTYYTLFLPEFAHIGEQERAIEQFEQLKIRYFVARRSQFLGGPMIGSDLTSYAPKIRAYLIEKYQIVPLGEGFVLLTRRQQHAGRS